MMEINYDKLRLPKHRLPPKPEGQGEEYDNPNDLSNFESYRNVDHFKLLKDRDFERYAEI